MEYKLRESEWGLSVAEAVLKNRGLTKARVNEILNPSSDIEEDTMNYIGLKDGIKLLCNSIIRNEKIVIVSDSDMDGVASTTIIYRFIRYDLEYENVDIITQRYDNKVHGFSEDIMEQIYNIEARLVIAPDGGSSDHKQHKELVSSGIKCLVLDHHEWERKEDLNGVVIINNQDGSVKNTALSGTGVTYKFVKYYASLVGIDIGNKYLDLVAVSLISDVCDMKCDNSLENRYYFNEGAKICNITNEMLMAIITKGRLGCEDKLTIKDIGFSIAPNVNAVIRMANIEDRMTLVRAFCDKHDTLHYDKIIKKTESYKRKQKKIVDDAVSKLEARIEEKNLLDNKVLIVNATDIVESSITGLVATKLVNTYKRPCMLFNIKDSGLCTGSARGYGDIDFKNVCEQSELFNWAMGHSSAFGYSIYIENLIKASEYFNNTFSNIKLEKVYEVDTIFNIKELDLNTIMEVGELSELWCNHIKEPLFVVKGIKLHSSEIQRFGSATYSFTKNDYMQFSRNFCKKTIYEEAIFKDSQPYGCDLVMDAIVKFTKNQKGFIYIEIVDWKTRINNEIIF